ncbi:MAG: serine hydrolase domain-containing protein [Chlamydiia bacterium]
MSIRSPLLLLMGAALSLSTIQPFSSPAHATLFTSPYAYVPSPQEAFTEALDRYLLERGFPGAIVVVFKNGELLLKQGIGECSDPDQMCPLASLTKLFTEVSIHRLIEQGEISLYTNVYDYFAPSYQPRDERVHRITIEDLLDHRGGWDREISSDPVFDVAGDFDLPEEALRDPRVLIEHVLTTTRLNFYPGDRCAYSNFGYIILGQVIEKASGLDYLTYVNQTLANPHGFHFELAVAPAKNRRELPYLDTASMEAALSSYGLSARLEDVGRFFSQYRSDGSPKTARDAMMELHFQGTLPNVTTLIRRRSNNVVILVHIPDRDECNVLGDAEDLKSCIDHAASRCRL